MGSDLHRHPSGYLTHRGKQRQAAPPVGNCLISDGDSARSDQPLSQRFVRGQMQIREQNLSLTQQRHFSWLRLLDLDDQFRGAEHLCGAAEDVGTCRFVCCVIEADLGARSRLDDHFMSVVHEFAHNPGDQADPILMGFHLLRDADQHR